MSDQHGKTRFGLRWALGNMLPSFGICVRIAGVFDVHIGRRVPPFT
jgi:hypothetical protein